MRGVNCATPDEAPTLDECGVLTCDAEPDVSGDALLAGRCAAAGAAGNDVLDGDEEGALLGGVLCGRWEKG